MDIFTSCLRRTKPKPSPSKKMASTDASQVLAGIKSLIANPPKDEAIRRELYESLKDLSTVIEDPHDTIFRICYSPLNLTFGIIASDLGIFEALVKSDKPLTVTSLAKTQNCDPLLMGRILRHLASQKMIKEVDVDTFTANSICQTLSKPEYAAGMRHNFEAQMPCQQKLPQFLADTKYVNPADVMHSAFQIAFETDLPAFVYAPSQPKMFKDLQLWMVALYGDMTKSWLDVYDFPKYVSGSGPDDVIFVDVAGGIGPQCALLKGKFPELKGRVILQDQPEALPHAIPTPGVEQMGFNMWQGQPVKGAKTYYMRMILHDYPDEKAIALLKLQAEAMTADSILVIDELLIPNKGAHENATRLDLTMMASLASIERTDSQWESLMEAAGFKILEKKTYGPAGESILVVVPKA